MRVLLCLWLVACWREAPPPREPQPQPQDTDRAPAPASRIVRVVPPPSSATNDVLAEFEDFANQLCQCADLNCASAVGAELQKWSESPEARTFNPTPEQQKQLGEISNRFADCFRKASSGSTSPTP